jgi:hypothetical protein
LKFQFEIDCTPEEARTLLGLPDLGPLQKSVLDRVEQQLLEAASSMSAEGIVKMWLSVIPQASEQYLKSVGSLMRSATKRATGRDTE